MVMFKIKRHHVPTYVADCKLWGNEAKKHRGFVAYQTLLRTNQKDHYASVYMWKSQDNHQRFMKQNHDHLVALSKCPVEILGYYNCKTFRFKHSS